MPEYERANKDELAAFDETTKQCTMNCGQGIHDPRSKKEMKFLCDECATVEAKIFCVTCGVWLPESQTGLTDGKVSECQQCTNARDAARYRWLRERDLDTISKGGAFAGLMPEKLVLNGADLDKAVDSAIRKSEEIENSVDTFSLTASI